MEVDGQRDLQKNDLDFHACLHLDSPTPVPNTYHESFNR